MYGVSTPFIIATIILGVVTFYLYRDRLDKIEEDQKKEQIEEQKRKKEFAGKFSRINRIPVFRNIVRWMYKEGGIYSTALVLIILVGFGIRTWNVGQPSFFIDEAFSFYAAKGILESSAPIMPDNTLYNRDILYHIFVAVNLFLIKQAELSLRLVSVFFGSGVILVSYFLTKLVSSKKHAMIVAVILSTSAIAISWDRYGRMYSALTFFTIIFILSLLTWLKNKNTKSFICLIILSILPIFIHKEFLSILFLALLIVLYLIKIKHIRINHVFKKKMHSIFFAIFSFIVLYILIFDVGIFSFIHHIFGGTPYWASQQSIVWYFLEFLKSSSLLLIFFFISMFLIFLLPKTKRYFQVCFFCFLAGIFLVGTVMNFGNTTRYAYFLYPLYIICASWTIYLFSGIKRGNIMVVFIVIAIILLSVSPITEYILPGENAYNPIINMGYNKWNEINFIENNSVIATSNLILTYKYIGKPTYAIFTEPSSEYVNATKISVNDVENIEVDYYILDFRARRNKAEYQQLRSKLRSLGYQEDHNFAPLLLLHKNSVP